MNRIPAEPFASSAIPSLSKWTDSGKAGSAKSKIAQEALALDGQVASGVIQASGSQALFAPLHYEANYAYPLLVWLHGGGDSEQQLRRVMPLVSLRNYVSVAPRGTMQASGNAGKRAGFRWAQSPEHIAQAEHHVQAAIAAARERFNVRSDRIFLVGYESGGTMALRIAMEHPKVFAGVVSLCGPFPKEGTPLAKLDGVRQMPLFIAACREGTYYPTEEVCNNLRLFHAAGLSTTLREYPGADGLSPMMLADIDRWMMEQISSSLTSATSSGSTYFPNNN
jgi:phospholipase/carboxylesterase